MVKPNRVRLGNTVSQIAQAGAILALVSFSIGIGAALDIERFRKVWKKPTRPLVGLLLQTLVNPGVMFALLGIFGSEVQAEAKIMAVAIAAAPGGSGSNVLSYLAHGNLEISIALTIVSTVFSFGTLPLFLYIGIQAFLSDAEIVIPWVNVFIACVTASLSPFIGILIQKYGSERSVQLVKYVGIAAGIGLVAVIVSTCGIHSEATCL